MNPVDLVERVRPSKLETLVKMATLLADQQSTCLRKQVACLAVSEDFDQIYSMGVNGNGRKGPNICDRPMERGNCGCQHAEANCLFKLRTTEPVSLVCTHSPCAMCAKGITVVRNIQSVYCLTKFRDTTGLEILGRAKIPVAILT